MKDFSKGENQFFIIGCQRSGTTLLELILDSHPNIQVIGESTVYSSYKNIDKLNKIVGYKAPYWTYKNDFFKETYPKAKYLFVFRDVKSIVLSMLSLKLTNNKIWAEAYWSQETERSINSISTFFIRNILKEEFKKIKYKNLILQTTFCVLCKVYLFDEYKKINLNIKRINYLDIVKNTKKTIQEALSFLSLKWHDNILKHHLLHEGSFSGKTDPKRSIDENSLDLWKERFSREEINEIDNYIIYLREKIYN